MIKPGEVKKEIKGISDNKSSNLGSLLDKSFRINNLPHPVAGKGEDIPQDDKPEEAFEFKPSGISYTERVNLVQQIDHSGDEEDMSDLMRHKTFSTSMRLYSIDRHCPTDKGECHAKTKGLEYGDSFSHVHEMQKI